MAAGRYGQFGFKSESTWGTPVTVDTFHEGYLSGNPVRTQPPLISKGINGRRFAATAQAGAKTVEGPFSLELLPSPLATLGTHMFGTVNTTGAGPYTHTYTPGDTDAKIGFTAQVGIPDDGGTVRAFTYEGCRIKSWSIKGTAGELAQFDLDVVAQDYLTATALASASYGTDNPFTFVDGAVTIAGSSIATVSDFELAYEIPRRVEHAVGSALILEPVESGPHSASISVTPKFEDLTLHDLANTQVAVILAFDNGTDSLTITCNAFVEPSTPTVGGADSEASETFSAICMGSTDAAAITAVLVNGEASAA